MSLSRKRKTSYSEEDRIQKEYDRLNQFCIGNNITIDKEKWQPLVAPLDRWRGPAVKGIIRDCKRYPHLRLNLAFEIFSVRKYKDDPQYKMRILPNIRERAADESDLLVFFPETYIGQSLNIQLDDLPLPQEMSSNRIEVCIDVIERSFRQAWPGCYMKFVPHGSFITGLPFAKSPINICIELDEPDLELYIENQADLTNSKSIPYSTGTVVRMLSKNQITRDKGSGLFRFTIDHTVFEFEFNKEITTESTSLILQYMKLDPRVKPFLHAVKQFGRARNIFSPQLSTGVRFYGYTIMALAYLLQLDPPVIPNLQHVNEYSDEDDCYDVNCKSKFKYWDTVYHMGYKVGIGARYHDCVEFDECRKRTKYSVEQNIENGRLYWRSSNTLGIGELFLDFLNYYAYRFNYEEHAVSLKFGGRTAKKADWYKHLVAIEDPFMSHVNLGAPVADLQKFVRVLRGSFTVLQSGATYEVMTKKVGEINRYDSIQGMNDDRLPYIPMKNWSPSATSKSFLLIDVPKETDDGCYCDRIRKLFSTHGVITKMLDLDATTKQVFFNADTGNAKDIVLPTSFTLNGKTVYLVELYEYSAYTEPPIKN